MASSDAIYREWQAVLGEIGELAKSRGQSTAAQPLARWRLIKINDAMLFDDVRRKTAAELATIRQMIAAAQDP